MGMLDRDAREVRAEVIPNVKRETLQAEILKQVMGTGKVSGRISVLYPGFSRAGSEEQGA